MIFQGTKLEFNLTPELLKSGIIYSLKKEDIIVCVER